MTPDARSLAPGAGAAARARQPGRLPPLQPGAPSPAGLAGAAGTSCCTSSGSWSSIDSARSSRGIRSNADGRFSRASGVGSPTNELIRHVLLVLLVADLVGFGAGPFLIATFCLHSVSMLVPYRLPWLIRNLTTSAISVGLLNVTLVSAWLVPWAAPVVAGVFVLSYLGSFAVASTRKLRGMAQTSPTNAGA